MTADQLMPSQVREKVLRQHREIEAMLGELEAGASRLRDDEDDLERVKRASFALRGILELHLTFEEMHMVPAVAEADGFGPERARHIHAEHAGQREHLDSLVHGILDANSPTEIRDSVSKLAEMLRADIEEEEANYVNEAILRDDIMPTDTFGG
ncbi:MAG: hemerythrin domain-containing protein [Myxococcota bacterium]